MKILSSPQIKEADAFTIENEPIRSIDLMERASKGFSNWYKEHFDTKHQVVIFCGTGNNGGDGLAIARLLLNLQYKVQVYIIGDPTKGSGDFKMNFARLNKMISIKVVQSENDIPLMRKQDVVIDAIFGSGLSRPVEGIHALVIDHINQNEVKKIIAVDIASGLFSEKPQNGGTALNVDFTLTFQAPKLALMMPGNEEYTGELVLIDVGLSSDFLEKVKTHHYFITEPFIAEKIKVRKKFGHKGHFGKALIIAGSKGKMGAAILASRACLRSGVGLLTVHTPKNCWPIIQSSVHEAMVSVDYHEDYFSFVEGAEGYDVLGIGPGLGIEDETVTGIEDLLKGFKKPIVIDADAINILGQNRDLLSYVPEGSVFTPHPKEFERLVGSYKDDYERLELQKKFSAEHKVYVLVKGAHTSVSTPEGDIYFNSTGNSGMATGGSGDILTGIITSLIAQKYDPLDATLISVFIHGLAGDLAAEELSKESMLPSDIIDRLGDTFKYLIELKKK